MIAPKRRLLRLTSALIFVSLLNHVVFPAAAETEKANAMQHGEARSRQPILLRAARIFDGNQLHTDAALLISGNSIAALGNPDVLKGEGAREVDLGDSTILPGFIELHGHIAFKGLPHTTLLEHGITTARDVGGPLSPPSGGNGLLRLLTSGPIITVPGGYPIPVFGHGGHGQGDIAATANTPEQARQKARDLIAGGAAFIKIALEPGGEPGAPWTRGHSASAPVPWPLPSLDIVRAITAEAHKNNKRVTAHVGEDKGVALALEAGVDEWAHIPCAEISEHLLRQAVKQHVKIVTTLDTLSHCPGIYQNAKKLAAFGAEFLYGAEIGHTDIPWGIDAQELHLMRHLTGMSPLELFQTATAKAGEHLGLSPLGTLAAGAPADLIAVRGNPFENFKLLEYPDMVMSGEQFVVHKYNRMPPADLR